MCSWKTYSNKIQNQLKDAGYFIEKNTKESCWHLKDGDGILMSNKALGDLLNKASKELGI